MKKMIALAMLLVGAAGLSFAQDVAGDWQGTLVNDMGSLRIVLHITKADGGLKGTMDSPDQAIVGMPVDSVVLDGSKLKIAANVAKIGYEGSLKNANTINGNWLAGGKKVPLDFKRQTTPIKTEHPPAAPSDIDGTWEGTMNLPSMADSPSHGNVKIVFHVKNTGDGLTATLDSPELNVKGWPAPSVTRKGSSIKIDMPQVGGSYQGKMNKDFTVMSGDWSTEHNYALTLKRAKDASANAQKQAGAPAEPAKQ